MLAPSGRVVIIGANPTLRRQSTLVFTNQRVAIRRALGQLPALLAQQLIAVPLRPIPVGFHQLINSLRRHLRQLLIDLLHHGRVPEIVIETCP